MKLLYLDCGMGAAGDMLSAALYELLDKDQKARFIDKINSIGIPNVNVISEQVTKCGIVGTHMKVMVGGVEEESMDHHHEEEVYTHHHEEHEETVSGHESHHVHTHSHEEHHGHVYNHEDHDYHEHSHEHHHTSMAEVEHIINGLSISDSVKEHAIQVYKLIAEAESHAHGVEVSEIHFHEVGKMDAIADVTAMCILMEMLGVTNVMASNIHVGSGHVRCAHGILPIPAPATAYILKDVPIYGGKIQGELCTPTGAALLKHFVSSYGEMPPMRIDNMGYGMGKKDFSMANCVRAMLGETVSNVNQVVELSCNVDDMTPEKIGFAMERFFDMGALEVYTVPIGMKKSRPGTMIVVMCKEDQQETMVRELFKHTTTLGIRENVSRRFTLDRSSETIKTILGDVRVKYSNGYGVNREKYEYDDLARIAKENNLSIDEVITIIKNQE